MQTSKPVDPVAQPPRRKRRPIILLAFVVFLLLLLTATGEVALRVYVWARGWTPNCYAAELELFRPHPEIGYDLKPNFRSASGAFRISTNARGLRGPDLDSEKPAGRIRIAILGESSAFGYLVSDGQEIDRLLESKLRAAGQNVEVLNGGVPGYNLFHTSVRYREVVAPLKPNLVILYLGWNDLTSYVISETPNDESFRVRPIAPAWKRLLGKSTLYGFIFHRLLAAPVRFAPATVTGTVVTPAGEQQFRENLGKLIREIRKDGPDVMVVAQCSAGNPKAEGDLRKALGDSEAIIQRMIELGSWLHDTEKEIAEKEGVRFEDAYMKMKPSHENLLDYIHLSAQGEEALADLLKSNLTLWIERKLSR